MIFVNVPQLPYPTISSPLTHLTHVRHALSHTCLCHAPRVPPCTPNSLYKYQPRTITAAITGSGATKMEELFDAEKLRSHFLQVLRSRRSSEGENQNPWMSFFVFVFWDIIDCVSLLVIWSVPLSVELAKPVANPLYQDASPPKISEVDISFIFLIYMLVFDFLFCIFWLCCWMLC